MSNKKRFTYEYDEYNGNLFDNEYNTFYPIEDSEENIMILVNRLNELDTFRTGYFSLEKQIKQLKDENHRLRLTMCHLKDLNIDIEWLKKNLR